MTNSSSFPFHLVLFDVQSHNMLTYAYNCMSVWVHVFILCSLDLFVSDFSGMLGIFFLILQLMIYHPQFKVSCDVLFVLLQHEIIASEFFSPNILFLVHYLLVCFILVNPGALFHNFVRFLLKHVHYIHVHSHTN